MKNLSLVVADNICGQSMANHSCLLASLRLLLSNNKDCPTNICANVLLLPTSRRECVALYVEKRRNGMRLSSLKRSWLVAASLPTLLAFIVVPATPSNASSATVNAAVVVLPNGWIDYNNTSATTMALTSKQTFTESGQVDANGNCTISTIEPSIPTGDSAVVSETSYNPTLCEATYVMGLTSPAEAISLGATPSSTLSAPIVLSPLTEYNNKVYYKTEYIDPLDITITSLAVNLSYNYSSTGVLGTSSTGGDGYHFAYDGWSGSAATFTDGINGGTTVIGTGYYRQQNIDFQLFMDAIGFGLLCTGSLTATFTQNMQIADAAVKNGGTPPPASNANQDTATGGCSNLVHFGAEFGSGTTS